MTGEPEIFEVLRKIRYDATAIQAKVSEALAMLARMNLPDPASKAHVCPVAHCRLAFATTDRLTEHLANVHDNNLRTNTLTGTFPDFDGDTTSPTLRPFIADHQLTGHPQ